MWPGCNERSHVADTSSPTFRRLLLGRALRELREDNGMTAEAVGDALDVTTPWITRIETGQRGIQLRDLKRLFQLYKVTDDQQKQRLLELARSAKQQGWWHSYKNTLPPRYADYIGLEASASSVRNVELIVVPGLLQTADYARALLTHGLKDYTAEEVERRVQVRLKRQESLTQTEAPHVHAILDEAVLRRQVGSAETMHHQLDHVLETAGLPNVTVQIIPLASGTHAGSSSSFVVLDFPGTATDPIPYIETVAGDLYLEKHSDIQTCEHAWTFLAEHALSPDDSIAMVTAIMKAYN